MVVMFSYVSLSVHTSTQSACAGGKHKYFVVKQEPEQCRDPSSSSFAVLCGGAALQKKPL